MKKDKKNEKKNVNENELLESRSIIISEPISKELAKNIFAQVVVLNKRSETEPIYVYINSPGGDADSGFAIYDMLRFHPAPITTICSGLCASAAVIVFLASEEGKNYSLPNSRFLLHQPSTGIQGSASDIQITADEILKTRERYNKIVGSITQKSVKTITKDADRDFWMSSEEALKYKLVSKIVTSKKDIK